MEQRHFRLCSLWANYSSLYIIACLFLLDIIQCATDSDGITPIITPNTADITVLPGENVQLICQSTEPIHWRFHDEFAGNHRVYDLFNEQNIYPHQSMLELIGVQHTYVGYYYCVKNSTELDTTVQFLVKNKQASKIYLFVDDPEHPIAHVSLPLIQGNQFEDVLVPCKPTSKKWDVQLIKEGDQRNKFDSTYNPTEGFRIKLTELTDEGYYTCHYKADTSNENDVHFHISMNLVGSKFVNWPTVRSKTDDFGVEGEQLELDCTVEAQLGAIFEISWALPNNNLSLEEGRAKVIETIAHNHPNNGYYYAVGKLIVNNLDKSKDIGTYKCFVEDDSKVHKSASMNILKIVGANESFIEITEPLGKYSLKVTPKIGEVKWIIKYRGYPTPKLTWYDNHGDEIPFSIIGQKGCKYEATQDDRIVTLKIREIRTSDSGYYTLHADNGRMQKEQKFQLSVISMLRRRPKPVSNTSVVPSACKSCTEVITRLDSAEKQIKMLRFQLKEAKELNIRARNEQIKYRDLYLSCSRGANNNL